MSRKIDIFEMMAAADRRDFGFLERLDEDTRKGFAPPVALRWASAISDGPASAEQILRINEKANKSFWDIYEHPELQYKLLASAGRGRTLRHQWVNMAKVSKPATKAHELLSKYWPDANSNELNILVAQFNRDSFKEFVDGCALPPAETQEILDAYDRFNGIEPEKKSKAQGGKRRKS